MKKYILAMDQGTSSSRAMLFDHGRKICGTAQQEFRQIFPQPGWVEHDANDIWQSQLAVVQQVMRDNDLDGSDIAAIGIANQRETTLLWDRKTAEPIANAIVWQDRRTAAMCDALRSQGYSARIQEKTGLIIDAYFSGTKLKYLLDHIPNARAKAERGELACGTIDAWLIYKLTGQHVTDNSNASRTMLFNIHQQEWDDELLAIFDIPSVVLPKVVPSSGIAAYTRTDLFGVSIPIAGIAGDQQAATFGQACHQEGMAKNTYGTGCFMLLNTGSNAVASHHQLLSTIGWKINSPTGNKTNYMLEGSVFMAGAVVQWLRDGLGIIHRACEIEALATSVSSTQGVVFVPAFAGLGAPYWDAYARGTIIGMTRGTNKAHIARAALESIALQSADVLDAMQKDASIPLKELRVDGGAARNDFLMQFQADVLGVPVVRPAVTETTALGAAYLAGLAVGFWSSQEEIAAQWRMERCFEPVMSLDERASRMDVWRRAIAQSRAWAPTD